MKLNLTHRKARADDLVNIIGLLQDDDLGKTREVGEEILNIDNCYLRAFKKIESDANHYLMVVEDNKNIIATCHLTIMPSLTFMGSARMQIEAVRVCRNFRGNKIGEWMINEAVKYAQKNDVKILQLTTNKERVAAKKFYEKIGFKASHEGMKLYL